MSKVCQGTLNKMPLKYVDTFWTGRMGGNFSTRIKEKKSRRIS